MRNIPFILICQGKDGDFWARPLPTWSRFPDCRTETGNTCCKVEAVFRLCRGENDRIVPGNVQKWQLDLLNSLLFHQGVPVFKPEARTAVAQHAMKYVEILQKRFGCFELLGDLDGSITAHAARWLEQQAMG